jgi:hypothetical protein
VAGESIWDWAHLVPEGRAVPDELLRPTQYPYVNLAFVMLSSKQIGNDALELVGELLAERARYNVWFGEKVEGSGLPGKVQATLYSLGRDGVMQVFDAWNAYRKIVDVEPFPGEEAGDPEYQNLLRTMREYVTDLAEARQNPQVP